MDKQEKILKTMFDGQYFPYEKIVPKDPEYKEVQNSLYEELHYISQQLSGSKSVEQLRNLLVKTQYMETFAFYCEGFRAGVQLMVESMKN